MIFLITFNIVARFYLKVKRFFGYFYNIFKKSLFINGKSMLFFENIGDNVGFLGVVLSTDKGMRVHINSSIHVNHVATMGITGHTF